MKPSGRSTKRGKKVSSETNRNLSVVVLGAGFAGLAATQRLRELGCHVEVYEKNSYVGGHAYSHQIDGFVFDEGAHCSFTQRPEIQSLFAQAVNGQFLEQDSKVLNYWRGYWLRHPVQCNLYGLPPDVIERCVVDFVKAQYEDDRVIETYADWCYRSLGRTFSEEFTFRYTRKYWAIEADNMSTDWLGPRMYPPKLQEVIRGALVLHDKNQYYIPHFRYPSYGGFGAYVRSVANGQDVNLGHEVVMVEPRRRYLEFANGKKTYFDALISSLPLPELIRCIKDVPVLVAEAADGLACTSLVAVNVGIERDGGFPGAHWMYFYDEDILFARGCFPHKFSPNNVPAGCGSIQVDVYHSKYQPLKCQDVLTRAIEDLQRTGLLLKEDHVLVAQELRIPYANVLFDQHRASNLAIVQRYLNEQDIICCGRYGEWAYFWTDDSIISGWQAAERVTKGCIA